MQASHLGNVVVVVAAVAHHHHKGPNFHHLCAISRRGVDGATGDTGASTQLIDIGANVDEL